MDSPLSKLSGLLISSFDKNTPQNQDKKISVNPVVSRVASWYEKLRNAMDYREDEVILRAAIERILKRRLLFGGSGKTIAGPLLRELAWARYFPDESVPEALIEKIERDIDLYLEFREQILFKHQLNETVLNEWVYHLMSASIEHRLNLNKEKEMLTNFMFQIMRESVKIPDDNEQTKDVQIFIAVRRNFAKDDLAFLRYHLFCQLFGELTKENINLISLSFMDGYKEIQKQLNYPCKDRIYNYIKKKTAVFFILEDLLRVKKGEIKELLKDEKEFQKIVFEACEIRYGGIAAKVRTAIIRSVIFIFCTKALFAFTIEGTFESIVYGKILWASIFLNTGIPPLLMMTVGLLIKTPNKNNSKRILNYIKTILTEENPRLGAVLEVKKTPDKSKPVLNSVFTFLWFATFLLAFGALIFVLTKLHFNIASQGVFIFFLAIVSFLSYRISRAANVYRIEDKQSVGILIVDFLFMPFVQVGRHLTEGISQINIFLFIFDFIIETPFKGMFSFFEQWFFFLQSKREKLE